MQGIQLKLCAHVLVTAEMKGGLENIIYSYKFRPGSQIYAKEGAKPEAKPRKGRNNLRKRPILETTADVKRACPHMVFSEMYHNDEPFNVLT